MKLDVPTNLKLLGTDEFPTIKLRNEDMFQDFSKLLNKNVKEETWEIWPPHIGFKFCSKLNERMVRCLVLSILDGEEEILGKNPDLKNKIISIMLSLIHI